MTSIRWGLPPESPDTKKARRERVAVAAMQGLLAASTGPDGCAYDVALVVENAVELADALLAELDREPSP